MSFFPVRLIFLPLSCATSDGASEASAGAEVASPGCGVEGEIVASGQLWWCCCYHICIYLPSPGSLGLIPSQQIGFFFHSRNAGHGAGLTGRTGRNPTLDSQFLHTMTQITLHYIVNIISSTSTRKIIYGIWTVDWLQHISNSGRMGSS